MCLANSVKWLKVAVAQTRFFLFLWLPPPLWWVTVCSLHPSRSSLDKMDESGANWMTPDDKYTCRQTDRQTDRQIAARRSAPFTVYEYHLLYIYICLSKHRWRTNPIPSCVLEHISLVFGRKEWCVNEPPPQAYTFCLSRVSGRIEIVVTWLSFHINLSLPSCTARSAGRKSPKLLPVSAPNPLCVLLLHPGPPFLARVRRHLWHLCVLPTTKACCSL